MSRYLDLHQIGHDLFREVLCLFIVSSMEIWLLQLVAKNRNC